MFTDLLSLSKGCRSLDDTLLGVCQRLRFKNVLNQDSGASEFAFPNDGSTSVPFPFCNSRQDR